MPVSVGSSYGSNGTCMLFYILLFYVRLLHSAKVHERKFQNIVSEETEENTVASGEHEDDDGEQLDTNILDYDEEEEPDQLSYDSGLSCL